MRSLVSFQDYITENSVFNKCPFINKENSLVWRIIHMHMRMYVLQCANRGRVIECYNLELSCSSLL